MICNYDCFNCKYSDCIASDTITQEERKTINARNNTDKEYKHSEKSRKARRRYYREHIDSAREYQKKYQKDHEEELREYRKKYYQNHKDEWKPRKLTEEQRKRKYEQAKKHRQRPEVKEQRRLYQIEYRRKKKLLLQMERNNGYVEIG